MFRTTTQQVLKTRISGQVVNTARNSINHSIRFNSVALDRAPPSTSTTSAPTDSFFTNTIKNVANLQQSVAPSNNSNSNGKQSNNSQKKGKRNNKARYNDDGQVNSSSPWFKQISAFRDTLAQITNFDEPSAQPFFWETLKRAMAYYEELKGTPDFKPQLVSLLVYALHTGLRANRNQLTRLAKKPDYDARSFHNEVNTFIKSSLREITNDMLNDLVQVNDTGAMHLLTSLKELKLDNEAVSVWTSCMDNTALRPTFLRPKVVGVLLPLMFHSGSKFEDLEKLYNESKSFCNYPHPHLLSGMIKTCLAAGENQRALVLFGELCDSSAKETYSALIDVHLAFIGDCKDMTIATTFFEKAINKEMPYKFTLHVNCVKQFLENIWILERDFDSVATIWEKATTFYGRNIHHGISSSLNNTFFDIFFEKYGQDKDAGLLKLKEIIAVYNDIKPIDEPFFNIIISKCTVWKDKSTVDTLYSAYSLYNLNKTQVSRRIYLKSLGAIKNITDNEILNAWYDLVINNDAEGYKYLANADWAALRDATFASNENKAELYARVLKQYQWFCRDHRQFHNMHSIVNLYPNLEQYLGNLNNVDASMIAVPQFTNMKATQFH